MEVQRGSGGGDAGPAQPQPDPARGGPGPRTPPRSPGSPTAGSSSSTPEVAEFVRSFRPVEIGGHPCSIRVHPWLNGFPGFSERGRAGGRRAFGSSPAFGPPTGSASARQTQPDLLQQRLDRDRLLETGDDPRLLPVRRRARLSADTTITGTSRRAGSRIRRSARQPPTPGASRSSRIRSGAGGRRARASASSRLAAPATAKPSASRMRASVCARNRLHRRSERNRRPPRRNRSVGASGGRTGAGRPPGATNAPGHPAGDGAGRSRRAGPNEGGPSGTW